VDYSLRLYKHSNTEVYLTIRTETCKRLSVQPTLENNVLGLQKKLYSILCFTPVLLLLEIDLTSKRCKPG